MWYYHYTILIYWLKYDELLSAAFDFFRVPMSITNLVKAYFGDLQFSFSTPKFSTAWQRLEVRIMAECTISLLAFTMAMEVIIRASRWVGLYRDLTTITRNPTIHTNPFDNGCRAPLVRYKAVSVANGFVWHTTYRKLQYLANHRHSNNISDNLLKENIPSVYSFPHWKAINVFLEISAILYRFFLCAQHIQLFHGSDQILVPSGWAKPYLY